MNQKAKKIIEEGNNIINAIKLKARKTE